MTTSQVKLTAATSAKYVDLTNVNGATCDIHDAADGGRKLLNSAATSTSYQK